MSYFNPELYNEDNLKVEDKKRVDELRTALNEILNNGVVGEYLNDKSIGKLERELLKEKLKPFLEFINNKAEFFISDMIISIVENYENE